MVNGDKAKFVFVFVPNISLNREKSFVHAFLRSLTITYFNNFESGKRNCCF